MGPVLMINLPVIHVIGRLEQEKTAVPFSLSQPYFSPHCVGAGGGRQGRRGGKKLNRSPATVSPNP